MARTTASSMSGDDATTLAFLLHGGDGCISGAAAIAPEDFNICDIASGV